MRYAWLCHPATVIAVIMLLVNDHLLKQAWPGLLTGKLSDVAGLMVAPAVLAVLLPRRADLAAVVVTGVAFTLVKTTQAGAELASEAWTLVAGPSQVLADPTDLLALPALGLAWWTRRRALATDPARVRRAQILITVPLAVFAVTATSGLPPPPAAIGVQVIDGEIVVNTDYTFHLVSLDGGQTWSERPKPRPVTALRNACVSNSCYRLPGGLRVDESAEGAWRTVWALSEGRRHWLTRVYERGNPQLVTSMALAVQARPGGHVVVVANGLDGIQVRDTAGTWRRVGWPGPAHEIYPRSGPLDPEEDAALLLAIATLLGLLASGLRKSHKPFGFYALMTTTGVYLLLHSVTERSVLGFDPFMMAIGLLTTFCGGIACLVLTATGLIDLRTLAVSLGTAALVYGSVLLPFHGWAKGVPDSHTVALAAAVVLSLCALAGGAALLGRGAERAT